MKPHQPDYIFISCILSLAVLGLIILSSASAVLSQDFFGQNYYYLRHQLIYGFLPGIIAFLICQKIYYKHWQKLAFPFVVLNIVLLSLVFVPGLGYAHGGARRWLGIEGVSFQPFELVKLTFIVYLAAILSRKGRPKEVIKASIKPFIVVFGIIALLVFLQPNMSAIVILVFISVLIYFLAGLGLPYILASCGLAGAALFVLIRVSSYRMERFTVFLHPESDPLGIGYQVNQALLAIGSGGLFGLGLGHSIQKWKYLPEVIGDSIFAVTAEELGFAGAGILVLFFIILAWRGFRIAKLAPDRFGTLLAGGISGWLFFQAIVNMAVISGLMPLTGMPLLFISYGGSALAMAMAGAGIVVNVSKYSK